VDSDCAGDSDYDADDDGHDHEDHGGEDCDDANDGTYPSATDTWYDGTDSDCAGDSDYDADGDGHDHEDHGGDDCNDGDDTIYAGAPDTWYDGVDSDCSDGSDYDKDGDGHDHPDDCNDANSSIYPGAYEYPWDGIDSNCTGEDESSAVISSYTGGGHTIYRMAETAAETRPALDNAWYQGLCEDVGLRPVACEWEAMYPEGFYSAADWNAVPLNISHYGCALSYGIEDLTGWTRPLTFLSPAIGGPDYEPRHLFWGDGSYSASVWPICTDP
jgi:hypothetical protein